MAVFHDSEAIQVIGRETAEVNSVDTTTTNIDIDECQFCGSTVTERFRKVFGDNQDIAHRCIQCDTGTRLQQGSAAGRNLDHIDPQNEPWRIRNGHANRGGAF